MKTSRQASTGVLRSSLHVQKPWAHCSIGCANGLFKSASPTWNLTGAGARTRLLWSMAIASQIAASSEAIAVLRMARARFMASRGCLAWIWVAIFRRRTESTDRSCDSRRRRFDDHRCGSVHHGSRVGATYSYRCCLVSTRQCRRWYLCGNRCAAGDTNADRINYSNRRRLGNLRSPEPFLVTQVLVSSRTPGGRI